MVNFRVEWVLVSIRTCDQLADKSSRSLKGWKTHTQHESLMRTSRWRNSELEELSLRRMRDRKSSEEALMTISGRRIRGTEPSSGPLAIDARRGRNKKKSAGEVHTVSPLRMGAAATPLRLTAM